GGLAAPARKRAVGRLDRLAALLRAQPRDGAQGLAGRRVGDRDRAAVQRVDPLAIDVALLVEQLRILELHRATSLGSVINDRYGQPEGLTRRARLVRDDFIG